MTGAARLGQRIRDARKQRRMTLERVSTVTGLSVGFLSQVERNITKPSLMSLSSISRALDITLSALLHEPDLPTAVSRQEGRVAHLARNELVSFEPLSTTYPSKMLNGVKVNIPAGFLSDMLAYEGEEIVYIISGTIRYIIDDVIYELQQGDSLHYSTARPHFISNRSEAVAEIISVGTHPLFDEDHRMNGGPTGPANGSGNGKG